MKRHRLCHDKFMSRVMPSLLGLALAIVLMGCQSVPITGRQQLMIVSPNEEIKMGATAFEEVLKKEKLSTDKAATEMVERVGARIAKASGRTDFKWEFKLVESNQLNAFCLPGGKVVVYTGILPVTFDENGLAAVMGHEVAHVLARHGAERVSQNMLSQTALKSADAVLSAKQPEAKKDTMMTALGLGLQYGVLQPYSRAHESEADKIGILLAAKAGYDPRAAVEVWKRMKAKGGQKPPEFLSTHPSDDTRIKQLEGWMPEAMKVYEASKQ